MPFCYNTYQVGLKPIQANVVRYVRDGVECSFELEYKLLKVNNGIEGKRGFRAFTITDFSLIVQTELVGHVGCFECVLVCRISKVSRSGLQVSSLEQKVGLFECGACTDGASVN
jgi:hypothetical protein